MAAHALGRLGAKEAASELAALLQDPNSDVRWWALRALGDLGATDRLEAIEKLRSDPSDAVRRAAEETLKALRKKS